MAQSNHFFYKITMGKQLQFLTTIYAHLLRTLNANGFFALKTHVKCFAFFLASQVEQVFLVSNFSMLSVEVLGSWSIFSMRRIAPCRSSILAEVVVVVIR